jgi:uncharacterized protein (TIGR02147 family)
MTNIFAETDYRTLLRASVEVKKSIHPKANLNALATAMGIQKPYLSKVLGGSADLSRDQLYLAGIYFGWNPREQEYVELLVEHERTQLAKRKASLKLEIEVIRTRELNTKNIIDKAELTVKHEDHSVYYLDPIHQIIHISLTIPKFQNDLSLLSQALSLSQSRLLELIENLERLSLIKREKNKWISQSRNIHLPTSSPLYRPWRQMSRSLASQRLQTLSSEEAYQFSVVFSADRETRNQIHAKFLEFLKQTESTVKSAQPKETFQLSFDLFSWA